MERKENKYSVVHKVWNKWQDKFEIETTTLKVYRELNSKKEVSEVMSVRVETIISYEPIKE